MNDWRSGAESHGATVVPRAGMRMWQGRNSAQMGGIRFSAIYDVRMQWTRSHDSNTRGGQDRKALSAPSPSAGKSPSVQHVN